MNSHELKSLFRYKSHKLYSKLGRNTPACI